MSLPPIEELLARARENNRPDRSPLQPRPGEWHITGPIPGDRLRQAAKLPGRALHVWLAILWAYEQDGRRRGVSIDKRVLNRFSIPPDAGRRGLAALEQAGLVTVHRHPGRAPRVQVNDRSGEDPGKLS